MEQQLTAGLGEGEIAEFIEDDEVEACEVVGDAARASGAAFGLELVDEVDGCEEATARSGADAASCDGDGQMRLARSDRDSDMAPGFWRAKRRCTTPFIRSLAGLWPRAVGASSSGRCASSRFVEVLDELDDVVIGHDAIVVDQRGAVLVLVSGRTQSKCRSLGLKGVKAHSPRLDSTVAMTRHCPCSSFAAAPMAPSIIIALMAPFRSFFTAPVWDYVLALVTGMTLAPGKRTVSAALRVIGLGQARDFDPASARIWSDTAGVTIIRGLPVL